MGQDPPGLRTLGEVAPENIYSDRSFKYLSEVRRKEAEEWIRSSTPREFARDFAGEESFNKALIRLEEGLSALDTMDEESKKVASVSFIEELENNFQFEIDLDELTILEHWRHFSGGRNFFSTISQLLGQLHLVGVVKFPSTDQKFISEVNATNRIDSKMIDLSDRLWIVGPKSEGLPKYLNPEDVDSKYLAFSNYLFDLHEHLENDGSFPDSGITLLDVIEGSDENASFSAQQYRNDLASALSGIAQRGLFLRSIDRKATTSAQDRAILAMDPPIISVAEGDLILKKGTKVNQEDLEKYSKFLSISTEDRNLLPKRIFITFGAFLFSIVYISLVLPSFWRDSARSGIVAVVILLNLGVSRIVLELGGTNLFGENTFLVGLLPYLMPVALASMVVMITVGPRMAALTAFLTSIFHATMQNSGIEALSISLSSSLVGVYFCRDVRLRGSVLKAGAMAGLTGAFLARWSWHGYGGRLIALANHAIASLVVGVLTGALVLGALPVIIEYVFKVATDATLFELMILITLCSAECKLKLLELIIIA